MAADAGSPEKINKGENAKRLRPRDAATLIIVDKSGHGGARVLMGKRLDSLVFMPGKFVFPGGRVDKADRLMKSADELSPDDTSSLLLDMKGGASVSRARALALAAVRETYEEAGLIIGASGAAAQKPSAGWDKFVASGYVPRLNPLTFIARAITPPGRPRRYDTRFFCASADAIAHRTDTNDGELSGLHWITLEGARDLDLPSITRVVLEDLAELLRLNNMQTPAERIPFYHFKNGSFRRDILSRTNAGEPVSPD